MQLLSTVICPECRHAATETMPTDACQIHLLLQGLWLPDETEEGRLLHLLLIRHGSVSANPGGTLLLRRLGHD
jgi:hypothetical protein